jgi:hypothetical protein
MIYLGCFFIWCCGAYFAYTYAGLFDQRHYCGTCHRLLAFRSGGRGRREDKGLKVYTRCGSIWLKPGEPLVGNYWNQPHEAEKVRANASVEMEKLLIAKHAAGVV